MYIYGMGITFRVMASDLIHQLLPGEYLAGVSCHFVQQHKLLLGKDRALPRNAHRQ